VKITAVRPTVALSVAEKRQECFPWEYRFSCEQQFEHLCVHSIWATRSSYFDATVSPIRSTPEGTVSKQFWIICDGYRHQLRIITSAPQE